MDTPKNPMPSSNKPAMMLSKPMMGIVFGVVGVLGLVGGYVGFKLLSNNGNTNTPTANTNASTNTLANANVAVANENLNVNASANANTNTAAPIVERGRKTNERIAWTEPKATPSLGIFSSTGGYDMEKGYGEASQAAKYYTVGKVSTGTYAGANIILVSAWPEGPALFPVHYHLIQSGSKLIYLSQNSPALSDSDGLNHAKFTEDPTYVLSDLEYPKEIMNPDNGFAITLVDGQEYLNTLFDATNLKPVFNSESFGTVYTTAVYNQEKPNGLGAGSNLFVGHGFYLKAPDGTVRVYEFKPPFVFTADSKLVPRITWTSGQANAVTYAYTDVGGCGSYNYLSVVDPSVVSASDLEKIGTVDAAAPSLNGNIYGLRNTQHPLLKKMYETEYTVYTEGQQKMSYEDFLAARPMFFWTDPFGRLVKFANAAFQPLTECGKPVIYLYPPVTTNVDVFLRPAGGFSKSEPTYVDGWRVTAQPDGRLTERSTGRQYPYLFWEGRGGIYQSPDQGFVVAQSDVHEFLIDSLAKLGLNAKETADFIEFWEPRMQGSPYYVVGFYGNRVMDALAPLTVNPKPDTVIRILMDYRPIAAPIAIRSQVLRSIPRTGFTVVEWGGVLR